MEVSTYSDGNSIVLVKKGNDEIINYTRQSACAGCVYSKGENNAYIYIPMSWLKSNNVSEEMFLRWMSELEKIFNIETSKEKSEFLTKIFEFQNILTTKFPDEYTYVVTVGLNDTGLFSNIINGTIMVLIRFCYDDRHYEGIVKTTFEILDSVEDITFFEAVQMACLYNILTSSSYSDYYGLLKTTRNVKKLVKIEEFNILKTKQYQNDFKFDDVFLNVNNFFEIFNIESNSSLNLLSSKKYKEYYDKVKNEIPNFY